MPPRKDATRIPKPGAEPFEFVDPDGTSRRLPIFLDPESRKETVECNRCGVHINPGHFTRHQGARVCARKAESNTRWQIQNAEREAVAVAVRIIKEKGPSFRVQSEFLDEFQGFELVKQSVCIGIANLQESLPASSSIVTPNESLEQKQPTANIDW